MLAGALVAGIAGFLKATVGAHEVITTIMLNWIAIWVGSYLFGIGGPLQTDESGRGAVLGRHSRGGEAQGLLGRPAPPGPAHGRLGRARVARRLRADAEPHDARLRGAGGRLQPGGGALRRHQRRPQLLPRDGDRGRFAGLAGALDSLGWQFRLDITHIQGSTIGFAGIAVALLGRNTAVGVGLAALLFAALERDGVPEPRPGDFRSRARGRASRS